MNNLHGEWAVRTANTMDLLVEQNKMWREHQIGAGASHGQSGDAIVEAKMPAEVYLLKLAENPNILQDDDAWYKWLRTVPKLRSYEYGKTGSAKVRVTI